MSKLPFLIGFSIPVCIFAILYFGYIRTKLSDKYLCDGDDKELSPCSGGSDVSICAKKGTNISGYCNI